MKNNNETAANAPLIPVDRELQEILMQVHAARMRLIEYVDSIHDRNLYMMIEKPAEDARENLMDAISAISQFAASQMAFYLIENVPSKV